jgi:hypothetical protein
MAEADGDADDIDIIDIGDVADEPIDDVDVLESPTLPPDEEVALTAADELDELPTTMPATNPALPTAGTCGNDLR